MAASLTIGLVGYGKMGKAIEAMAEKQGLAVGKIITSNENQGGEAIRSLKQSDVDILLDFTNPAAVVDNIQAAAEAKINMVIGTTGWYDKLETVRSIVDQYKIGLFYASNFSIGMNIMYRLVQEAVRLANGFPEYDTFVHEMHHNQKKDSPSGSAYTLANIILNESTRKKHILTDKQSGLIDPETLHVSSTRAGSIVGTHIAGFDSDFDSIEIKHSAKNRVGFVQGALRAAQWVNGRTGLYTMDDFLRA